MYIFYFQWAKYLQLPASGSSGTTILAIEHAWWSFSQKPVSKSGASRHSKTWPTNEFNCMASLSWRGSAFIECASLSSPTSIQYNPQSLPLLFWIWILRDSLALVDTTLASIANKTDNQWLCLPMVYISKPLEWSCALLKISVSYTICEKWQLLADYWEGMNGLFHDFARDRHTLLDNLVKVNLLCTKRYSKYVSCKYLKPFFSRILT